MRDACLSKVVDPWGLALEFIRARTSAQQYETWFRSLRCLEVRPDVVRVGVRSSFYKEWMERNYHALFQAALGEALGAEPRVEFVIHADAPKPEPAPAVPRAVEDIAAAAAVAVAAVPAPPAPLRPGAAAGGAGAALASMPAVAAVAPAAAVAPPALGGPAAQPARTAPAGGSTHESRLCPHYTFDTFVVGPENRLAHAASVAVTENPATAYNPLFLHGGIGLGKTHLLQAIGHGTFGRNRGLRVSYLSCETFVNEYIAAIQRGGHAPEIFRDRYRSVDVLLVDDIHFLANKDHMQEEFFNTFNTLYNAQKQIVLSCDSPPQEIPEMEDRLRSRFNWGLVIKIELPGYETKMAIIQRKAQQRAWTLPKDVVEYIAQEIDTNIREIEGAVLKLIGIATLEGKKIDLALAREALRDVVKRSNQPSIEEIMGIVSRHFNVKSTDLQGKRRSKSIAFPRQVCMFLARQLTSLSLEQIGGYFGNRDHTTVLYADRVIREQRDGDQTLRDLLDRFARDLQRG